MDSPYIYERLPRAGQIRLLELQPGTGDIHFTLTTACLHEKPEYEVISYCWGDASNPKTVYCDGKSGIQVTNSLYTALQRFRKPDQARTLWADAVCINQKDNVEKGQQVNLMSRIYSQPRTVLIWLGDDMTGLDGLEESMKGAMELLPPETEDQELLLQTSRKMIRETAVRHPDSPPHPHDTNPLTAPPRSPKTQHLRPQLDPHQPPPLPPLVRPPLDNPRNRHGPRHHPPHRNLRIPPILLVQPSLHLLPPRLLRSHRPHRGPLRRKPPLPQHGLLLP